MVQNVSVITCNFASVTKAKLAIVIGLYKFLMSKF
jgi:hypothetical protein